MVPLIDTAEALAALLPQLAAHARIAVDTEADSLHCYFEKLCLIQISVPGCDALVDPLAPIDLTPLFETWAGKELIFHGADYDLRLLRRVGCPPPTRLFDTMIAARLCGLTEFSYAALTARYFSETLTKSSQKANWARRPLPAVMTDYAVKDSHYLHQLADIFGAELDRLGRRAWFDQSCERAIRATENTKERSTEESWKIPGSGVLRGRAAAALRELWRWRDDEAQRVDKPAFHILHNEQLLHAARQLDAGHPMHFHHLRSGRKERFEAACARALALDPEQWPKHERAVRPKPIPDFERRFNELKKKRDAKASALSLDPTIIAARAALERLVIAPEEARDTMLPWQRELLELG